MLSARSRTLPLVLGLSFFWGISAAFCARPGRSPKQRYAIVVAKKTLERPKWKEVAETLRKKHNGKIFSYREGKLSSVKEELKEFSPRHVCFVAPPEELERKGTVEVRGRDGRSFKVPLCGVYYREVGLLMTSLDSDPYDDALWAVLTGATPADALRVVEAKPLEVRRGLSHVGGGWLKWLESGISFSETKKSQKFVKKRGKAPKEVTGPPDTTAEFVEELNGNKADMVSTSGHATEHDWQMGFSYRSGQIVTPPRFQLLPEEARRNFERIKKMEESSRQSFKTALYAVDSSNNVYAIRTDNPKIYYSPGNCRIARVDGKECMVLGWIHHGAFQFFGHVGLQTRSCYAWGIAEYFLSLQDRFSFAEAVWLNQQALWHTVAQMKDGDRRKYVCCRNQTCLPAGRSFFWETTVLYGDPAWEARVKRVVKPLYDQRMRKRKLSRGALELIFTVTMRRSTVPSRPAAFFLDIPGEWEVEVRKGPENLVVTENFALIPFWKRGQSPPKTGTKYTAVVRMKPCR